ncbi:unnamed protein product [Orchesella dallaii]|uniref:Methyl farnesoate epoxidase n=1 Tax=Orchesella dallaii TaxID=48710 RepID=A0ABP1R6P6_9HEXA
MIELLSLSLTPLLALLLVLFVTVTFKRRQKNLAPGPFPFPILGNLVQMAWINPIEPQIAFAKLGEKYGNIMSIQLGSVYSVVLNSFEVMEEYLTKPEFSDRYFNSWMSERTFGKRLGVIVSEYPSPWQQLRRFSHRTLKEFGFGKRNKMHPIIQAELEEVVRDLKERIEESDGVLTVDGYFTISALNLVWSILAGKRYEHCDPKLLRLNKVVKEFFSSSNTSTNILFAYPEWRNWFPDWTGMTLLRNCYRETNSFFQEIIEERKDLGVYKTMPENLIDEFLHEIESSGSNDDIIFTEQQLVGIMSDFFLAGSETSSNTLAYCILYLMVNPQAQEKLQREIDAVLPHGFFPSAEHEPLLHYARATLAETHRMGSVFPLMGPRTNTEDTFCGKFFIPKGTYIIANIHKINYDETYWKDPKSFRPERFIDENGHFKTDPRLKPFGFGKRACLGESMASMSLLHSLVVLMQNFTFRPVPNEPLPSVEPVNGITNGPQVYRALVECRG